MKSLTVRRTRLAVVALNVAPLQYNILKERIVTIVPGREGRRLTVVGEDRITVAGFSKHG